MSFMLLFRYFKSFAVIKVYDGFTERFVNLCSRERIQLWDVTYEAKCIKAKVYCKDFKKLKAIRKKSGTKIKVLEKHGLTYLYRKHKERRFLISGLVVSVLIMLLLNMFIWNIEVIGSETLSKSQILEVTEKLGLKTGTFAPFFDCNQAGREAVNNFDGRISWLAINTKGSKATVEVRDFEKKEEISVDKMPCNYIADFDGLIVDAYTFSGVQKAVSGSSVKRGNLLISGVSENEDGSISYLHSDGIFTAVHNRNSEKSFTIKKQVKIPDEINIYYSIYFFGISIPLDLKSASYNGEKLSYTCQPNFSGNALPVGIKKNVVYKFKQAETDHKALNIVDAFSTQEYSQLKNSRIITFDYEINSTRKNYSVTANYKCIDFIGEKSEIVKEN